MYRCCNWHSESKLKLILTLYTILQIGAGVASCTAGDPNDRAGV